METIWLCNLWTPTSKMARMEIAINTSINVNPGFDITSSVSESSPLTRHAMPGKLFKPDAFSPLLKGNAPPVIADAGHERFNQQRNRAAALALQVNDRLAGIPPVAENDNRTS